MSEEPESNISPKEFNQKFLDAINNASDEQMKKVGDASARALRASMALSDHRSNLLKKMLPQVYGSREWQSLVYWWLDRRKEPITDIQHTINKILNKKKNE